MAMKQGTVNYKDWKADAMTEEAAAELTMAHDIAVSWHLEHDILTGLYNRMTFYEKTRHMLISRPDRQYVMIYCDIERFKVINELLGTEAGDRILVEIANKLDSILYGKGTYGRLEADHFIICFSTDTYEVEWVLGQLDENSIAREMNCNLSLYFGIYQIDDIYLPVNQMCDRATLALRTVKGNYWKRYALYNDEMRQSMLEEQQILSEMDMALKNHEFCVYLQPIYGVMEERPVSAEALVRWQHPVKGLMSPGVFIPLFERNGFITELDEFVWEEVCRLLAELKGDNKPIVPVSVNVSRINFYNPQLCEKLVSLIRRYDLEPALLKLEVTESAYTDNPRQLLDTIKYLQTQGFQILMDDFGSGYSSLNMLKDMPIDVLKIDMGFLKEVSGSGRAVNVLTSVVRMAKWLEMEVVAEGVETKEQFDMLRSIGCDCVQGYYFSKPVPPEQFMEILRQQGMVTHRAEEISFSRFNFETIWESNSQFNQIFDGMIGGMGLYEMVGDRLEVVRVNDGYYKLMGCTPQTLFCNTGSAFSGVYEQDKPLLLQRCRKAKESGSVEQVVIRKHRGGQTRHVMWLDVKLRYVGMMGTRELLYLVLNDITIQKELENSQYLNRYSAALQVAFREIVELDYTKQICRSVNDGVGDRRIELSLSRAISEYSKRIHPQDVPCFISMHDEHNLEDIFYKQGKTSVSYEVRRWVKGQGYCWFSFFLIKLDDVLGRMLFLSCCKNIQEEKNAERIMEQNRILEIKQKEQQRYRIVAEQTGTVVLELDFNTQEFYADPGYEQFVISRYSGDDMLVSLPGDAVFSEDEPLFSDYLKRLYGREPSVSAEVRLKKMDGQYVWCRIATGVAAEEDGVPCRYISTINVIDGQKKAELNLHKVANELQQLLKETERRASYDGVSQLLNHAASVSKIESFLHSGGKNQSGAFLLFDIDDFKRVNDTMGHVAGDQLIRTMGAMLNSHFREQHIVGRLGGDEFVVFLRSVDSEAGAAEVAKLIMGEIKGFQQSGKWKTEITISMGIAIAGVGCTKTFEELYEAADKALYQAKDQGKNQYRFYQ